MADGLIVVCVVDSIRYSGRGERERRIHLVPYDDISLSTFLSYYSRLNLLLMIFQQQSLSPSVKITLT